MSENTVTTSLSVLLLLYLQYIWHIELFCKLVSKFGSEPCCACDEPSGSKGNAKEHPSPSASKGRGRRIQSSNIFQQNSIYRISPASHFFTWPFLTVLDAESISERHQSRLHRKEKSQLQYQRRRRSCKVVIRWSGMMFTIPVCHVSWFGLMVYLALFELSMSDVRILHVGSKEAPKSDASPSTFKTEVREMGISIDRCWCLVHLCAIERLRGDHVELRWFVPSSSSHTLPLPVPCGRNTTWKAPKPPEDKLPTPTRQVLRIQTLSICLGIYCSWSSLQRLLQCQMRTKSCTWEAAKELPKIVDTLGFVRLCKGGSNVKGWGMLGWIHGDCQNSLWQGQFRELGGETSRVPWLHVSRVSSFWDVLKSRFRQERCRELYLEEAAGRVGELQTGAGLFPRDIALT